MRGAIFAAVLLASAPAAAQDVATPAENLDCAVWAAYLAGSDDEPELQSAFAIVLSWFVGLYEGQSGAQIDDPLAARAAQLTEQDLETIGERCLSRVEAYGDRLEALGNRLQ